MSPRTGGRPQIRPSSFGRTGAWLLVWWLGAVASLAGGPFILAPQVPLSTLPSGLSSLMPVPVDNPLTPEKIELGRRLFFDPGLSRDGRVSCASCHQPDKGFTDGRPLAVGIDRHVDRRNVPTLINCAYGHSMFWDGRVATLEDQALLPLTNAREMGNTPDRILTGLSNNLV